MIEKNNKLKIRKLTTYERNATEGAIRTLTESLDLVNYNIEVNKLAVSKGIDYRAKAEKQRYSHQLEELYKQKEQTEKLMLKLNNDLKNGVEVKEKIDFNKINFEPELMKEFIKFQSLERVYLEFINNKKVIEGENKNE